MPPPEVQISAFVSATTKEEIERYTRKTGVKKNHLVQEALAHHLIALRELPADIVVHPRLVVSAESGQRILRRLNETPDPQRSSAR